MYWAASFLSLFSLVSVLLVCDSTISKMSVPVLYRISFFRNSPSRARASFMRSEFRVAIDTIKASLWRIYFCSELGSVLKRHLRAFSCLRWRRYSFRTTSRVPKQYNVRLCERVGSMIYRLVPGPTQARTHPQHISTLSCGFWHIQRC